MSIKKRSWAAACIMAAAPLVGMTASAGDLDGSGNIVCAVLGVVGCVEGGACAQGEAKSFDLPSLFVFDAKKKVIRSSDEAGHKEVSPVKSMEKNGNHLILQGSEQGRGWDVAINTETGGMSGAVVGDALGMLVSGACTAL